ncbi:hypothetical protein [Photobacterium nomapromontoriensis]|uniref:hypothetical protein n=1 Tax=Photobacterium nomapromontoriensis TaxID=2910237 RepID=UPI003D118B0D
MIRNLILKATPLAALLLTGCGVEKPPVNIAEKAMTEMVSASTMGMAEATFSDISLSDCKKMDVASEAELTVNCEISAEVSMVVLGIESDTTESITERATFEKKHGAWYFVS